MRQYITRLNVSIFLIIISVIVAISTHGWWYNHFNGGVVLFLITTVPLIAFPFLWTVSIYKRQEKKRQQVMKGKWK
tara:strand:- start:7786 stop:8013 length:228 start_codon:yes stop_codon:yes gene_type:complete